VIEDIEGNDKYGDCVLAEDAHYIAVVTGNANTLYAYTDTQVLADYTAITGFNASIPSTDQGTDPIVALNYRVTTGYADGSKDAGWVLVDATNQNEVAYALATFGNLKMWFGVPEAIIQSMPSASGFVWDVTMGSAGQDGHCIGSCGFNVPKIQVVAVTAQGLLVMTWGMLGIITWAAVAAWFVPSAGGGMAVRVSQDWINQKTGVAPSGLNLSALIAAFDSYFGGSVQAPPAAPPAAPLAWRGDLALAQEAAAAGISKGGALLTKTQAIQFSAQGLAASWTVGGP
jgi:hypothetical protein